MSCSNSINGYTTARFLYRGVSAFRQSYSCGRCASCIQKQRTDWRVRAYYESLSTLRKSGAFVLFDTLTYSDVNIKRYCDLFPELEIPYILNKFCFSRDDVQRFFKRLRINLSRAGYRFSSEQLRYILTSEYGSSEKTRGFVNTHRPHYHILFFVSFPISPIEFSRFVSRSWPLGKTDGVRPYEDCSMCPVRDYCKGSCMYQSSEYVINERLVNNSSQKNCIKCVNYVTKYISKDMYMTSKLQNDVDTLWYYLHPGFFDDLFLYRKYRRFCSQVLPFHLQSIGFGLSLLEDLEEKEYLLRTGEVHLPTGEKDVVRSVALPRYYQRKLFYNYEKVDGRVRWFLNDFGIDMKLSQLDIKIERFCRDYRAFDDSISEDRLFDLVLYKCVYKGTLTDRKSLMLPYWDYYRLLISPHSLEESPLYINRNTKTDKLTIGAFLSTRYLVTSDGEIIFKGKQLHGEFLPYDGYVVVNDKTCKFWNGFDKRLASFEYWKRCNSLARDSIAYADSVSTDYYKQLGFLK